MITHHELLHVTMLEVLQPANFNTVAPRGACLAISDYGWL